MFLFQKTATDRLCELVSENPKLSATLTLAALGVVYYVMSQSAKKDTAIHGENAPVVTSEQSCAHILYSHVNGNVSNSAQGHNAHAKVAYAYIKGDIDNRAIGQGFRI